MKSALATDVQTLWRMRVLLWVMTQRELATRHAATAVGVLWPYLQPMLTIAAYYLVFDVVFAMRLGDKAPTQAVGAYLIVGALPWMAFCDGLSRGMSSLVDAGSVLQKNPLPPVLFPVRAIFASTLVYAPLTLMVAMIYFPLHQGSLSLISVLPLMLFQIVLTCLLGYGLAILAAALRDTVQLVGFVLSVGIYLSPALFPLSLFPEAWRWVLWLNPMTAPILGFQNVLLLGQWPDTMVWTICAGWLMVATATLAILVKRSRDQVIDWL